MLRDVLLRLTPVTGTVFAWTVTAHVAFLPPSFVVTVIVAEPADFAVTTPEDDTVATDVLLDDHVTALLVALDGVTVAWSVYVSPSVRDKLLLSREMFSTGTVTETVQTDVFPPSLVVAVMLVFPASMAVTTPSELTVAILIFEDFHDTVLSVASSGRTTAVKDWDSPINKSRWLIFKLIEETGTYPLTTVIEQLAVLPPAIAVIIVVPSANAETRPDPETVATDVFVDVQVIPS